MRRMLFVVLAAATLAGCATAQPAMDKAALAREVVTLSGEMEDLRAAAGLMGFGLDALIEGAADARSCRQSLDKDAPLFARMACEALESALAAAREAGRDAEGALANRFADFEGKAAQALMDTYSTEELAAMRRYYASPEGRSIMAKRREYWKNLARRLTDDGRVRL